MKGSWVRTIRASDTERERTVRVLREATVQGQLSHDSFVGRVDQALSARDRDDLWGLVADLGDWRSFSRPGDRPASRRRRGRHYPVLRPFSSTVPMVIGRRPDCDIIIEDPSVSRVHAVLLRYADTWVLADHDSTNGTRVNGEPLVAPTAVFPGDLIGFGLASFQLVKSSERRFTDRRWRT
jgi:hypothetical protein